LLADYPLRSRETLSDVTGRVIKHLEKLAARDKDHEQNVWLVRHDEPARIMKLQVLLEKYDNKRNPTLDDATVILAPELGGLNGGLLDGSADFDAATQYDLGPRDGERCVFQSSEKSEGAPDGMRLVRTVKIVTNDDEVVSWWHLYATSLRADDDGSRTARADLLLNVHLRRTEAWAARIADRLGLAERERKALAHAGRAHDLGKQRRVWQRSVRRFAPPWLAKGRMQPAELGHYRHELGSLLDADFSSLSPEIGRAHV
jgi:CRISPR-associated helicase Cas3